MVRGSGWWTFPVALVAAALVFVAGAAHASASSATLMGAQLGGPAEATDAVYSGAAYYVFRRPLSDPSGVDVVHVDRYDPVADSLATLNVTIPGILRGAVWTGSSALVLVEVQAGATATSNATWSWRFYRFWPAGEVVTGPSSPFGVQPDPVSLFWDGARAYIAPESAMSGPSQHRFIRYDPGGDTWATLAHGFGAATPDMGGVSLWTGSRAYTFGLGGCTCPDGKVFRTVPGAATTELLNVSFPVQTTAAVWMGGLAYAFAGQEAFVLDLEAPGVPWWQDYAALPASFVPLAWGPASAASLGPCEAHIFGGLPPGDDDLAHDGLIVRYRSTAGACATAWANGTSGQGGTGGNGTGAGGAGTGQGGPPGNGTGPAPGTSGGNSTSGGNTTTGGNATANGNATSSGNSTANTQEGAANGGNGTAQATPSGDGRTVREAADGTPGTGGAGGAGLGAGSQEGAAARSGPRGMQDEGSRADGSNGADAPPGGSEGAEIQARPTPTPVMGPLALGLLSAAAARRKGR